MTRRSTIDGIVTRHIGGLADNHQPLMIIDVKERQVFSLAMKQPARRVRSWMKMRLRPVLSPSVVTGVRVEMGSADEDEMRGFLSQSLAIVNG